LNSIDRNGGGGHKATQGNESRTKLNNLHLESSSSVANRQKTRNIEIRSRKSRTIC
jgi:hypothetical protein